MILRIARSNPRVQRNPVRLTQIKLAGFKSFVDPTSILLPGQLVGIVGPNGCGKSNVIDAVRWVLGESRASALRGDSMQDVIFKGSGNRQPHALCHCRRILRCPGHMPAQHVRLPLAIGCEQCLVRDHIDQSRHTLRALVKGSERSPGEQLFTRIASNSQPMRNVLFGFLFS